MKRLIGLVLIGICIHTQAQQDENRTLQEAINIFDDAVDVNGMLESITLFKKATILNPDNWINTYWTAFAYSQCGRLTETPLVYYDTAQTYLDRTKEKLSSLDLKEKSDVYTLESLINSLKAGQHWAKGDREMGMKLNRTENESLTKAMALNVENPRVYLLTATSLITDGRRTKNDGYILAGRKMLEIAKQKYEANKSENPLYPDWGSGWVNFWISNAKLSGE